MAEETLDPKVPDTPNPEAEEAAATAVADKKAAENNPNIDVDSGEDEAVEGELPKSGNWYDNLGPDYRSDPDITKYKSLEEYAKGNREVRKMVGKDKLIVPGKDASQEELDTFYNKLGRPEELTGYNVPQMDVPDEITTAETDMETFKTKAHEIGLTDAQFQALYQMQMEMTIGKYQQGVDQGNSMAANTEKALRSEYGDAYEAKVDGAQKVINTFFKGQEMHPAFGALSSDTGFVRAMATIAEKLGEDVMHGETRNTLTPVEAQKEWDSIIGGNHALSAAYFDSLAPEHQAAVDKVISLQQMASAGGN